MTQATKQGLALRYGEADANTKIPENWNPVLDQWVNHRSVRAFDNKPLPEGTLEALIAAAQSAATSSNLQVLSVVAVQDPSRSALKQLCFGLR